MKRVYLLLFSLFIFSCKKDKTDSDNSDTGSIEYKVDGTLITMANANLSTGDGVVLAKQLKGNLVPQTRYLLNAQKGVNNVMVLTIVTDSLQVSDYHYDSSYNHANFGLFMFDLLADGTQSTLYYNTDYLDVKITSYKSGHVSGTFNAKLTPLNGVLDYNSKGSVIITDGKLNNIPIIY